MVRAQQSRLKSISCFLSSVRPADFHPKVTPYYEWQHRLNTKTHSCSANLTESLARGHTIINKGITSSKLVSFADDTRVYSNIAEADDCDNLQHDLNSIYNWDVHNNMFFNSEKFHYI